MNTPVFSHLALNVTDLDRAVAFYCDVLGLKKAFEIKIPESVAIDAPEEPVAAIAGKVFIAYIDLGNDSFLELFRPLPDYDLSTAGPNRTNMGYTHLSLHVEDLASYLEELQKKGVVIDEPMTLGHDNTYQAWIKDPDGNRIELMQYTPESFQLTWKK